MSQNAIWYDNLLDFFMLFVLIMQIGTQLGHEKVVKMDPFFGCLGYTEYQKGVVVEAQSWHLCTGSGFIPGKSQNTLELAIATGKCRKSLLAAEARLWPIVLGLLNTLRPSDFFWNTPLTLTSLFSNMHQISRLLFLALCKRKKHFAWPSLLMLG